MSKAIVLSQPLRLPQAEVMAKSLRNGHLFVVTSEDGSADFDFGEDVSVVMLPVGDAPGTTVQKTVQSLRASLRGDSRLGRRLHKWLRGADWRLRHIDRLSRVLNRRAKSTIEPDMRVNAVLREIHESDPIEAVVVMDLFDLHAVLEFASETGATVTVR